MLVIFISLYNRWHYKVLKTSISNIKCNFLKNMYFNIVIICIILYN